MTALVLSLALAASLTVQAGESWLFRVEQGRPVAAHRVAGDGVRERGIECRAAESYHAVAGSAVAARGFRMRRSPHLAALALASSAAAATPPAG